MTIRYAYLHGFASSSKSAKGVALREAFAARGVDLALPDLNRPDFGRLTITGALEAVRELVASDPQACWRLIGSSMGGWVAALWAAAGGRTDRQVLLCPGFGLIERWPALLGPEVFEVWAAQGALIYPDGAGEPTPVHYGFVEDARRHDPAPSPVVETLVIHGAQDETVPVSSSTEWVSEHEAMARLIVVDDDHRLTRSHDLIAAEVAAFFALPDA